MFLHLRESYEGLRSLFAGMRITVRQLFLPVVTMQYPHEHMPMTERFRGHIELRKDEQTGEPKCVVCMACQRACPSSCIDLDGVKVEGRKTRMLSRRGGS